MMVLMNTLELIESTEEFIAELKKQIKQCRRTGVDCFEKEKKVRVLKNLLSLAMEKKSK